MLFIVIPWIEETITNQYFAAEQDSILDDTAVEIVITAFKPSSPLFQPEQLQKKLFQSSTLKKLFRPGQISKVMFLSCLLLFPSCVQAAHEEAMSGLTRSTIPLVTFGVNVQTVDGKVYFTSPEKFRQRKRKSEKPAFRKEKTNRQRRKRKQNRKMRRRKRK